MSYCRWSSDSFRCDVYVYESEQGFETHVARTRVILPANVVAPSVLSLVDGTLSPEQFCAANNAFHEALDAAPKVAIEHPEAGASFVHDTPGECADNLSRLAVEGFRIPAGVIDALRAEQVELDAAC